ncbi:MAG TPA: hypothetical protein VLP43_03555 [Solirubrobacteraceae bacterium]|nr:hypothetical protein [Solirubrobacteraceae bacterium]
MLILPPGHAEQQVRTLRPLGGGERRLMRIMALITAALTVVVVIALVTGGHSTSRGCVNVNLPYSTGGSNFYGCGARARDLCATVGRPGTFTGPVVNTVAAECRKAGLPVG